MIDIFLWLCAGALSVRLVFWQSGWEISYERRLPLYILIPMVFVFLCGPLAGLTLAFYESGDWVMNAINTKSIKNPFYKGAK